MKYKNFKKDDNTFDDFYHCEFCGCYTNAKMRACCDKGREADKKKG